MGLAWAWRVGLAWAWLGLPGKAVVALGKRRRAFQRRLLWIWCELSVGLAWFWRVFSAVSVGAFCWVRARGNWRGLGAGLVWVRRGFSVGMV